MVLLFARDAFNNRGCRRSERLHRDGALLGNGARQGPRDREGYAGRRGQRCADILAVVEDQFYDMRKRLDGQLTCTQEVQQQLDAQQREIAELRRSVDLAHQLLKDLIANSS